MGIVAFCPSGHRIKVKDHLAGKKGICPHCGTRFRIPAAGAVAAAPAPDLAATGTLPMGRLVSRNRDEAVGLPRVLACAAAAAPDAEPDVDVEAEADAGLDRLPPVSLHPVLGERPDLAWCLAVPGGQPSQPLSPESVQQWLDSGGATGEELVWRSDWTEWVPIGRVFPGMIRGGG